MDKVRDDSAIPLNVALLKQANSLNFIRLCLASLVIVGHAPLMLLGPLDRQAPYLQRIGALGEVSVCLFFVISGYLILASANRSRIGTYIVNRLLRIFPGYWGSMLFLAFIAAPLALVLDPVHSSWRLADSLSYLLHTWNLYGPRFQWNIGSTITSLPIPQVWNGPLWTLRYELLMYILLVPFAFIAFIRRNQRTWISIAWIVAILLTTYDQLSAFTFPVFENFPWLLAYFLSGSMLYAWGEKIPVHKPIGIGLLLAAYALFFASPELLKTALIPLFAYGVLVVAVSFRTEIGNRRDLSYGLYIYGWPIQQLLLLTGTGALGIIANATLTLLVTLGVAFLSWTLIEHPALVMKRKLKRRTSAKK